MMKPLYTAFLICCCLYAFEAGAQQTSEPSKQVIYINEQEGKIGINNANPATAIDVNGSGTFRGDLIIADDNAKTQAKIYGTGLIRAREITVDKDEIPDFVFEPDYTLMPLTELNEYINCNKHLPDIPSAGEYECRDGVNVGELQLLLLRKVEELTLYMIQQEQRIAELESRLKEQKP